MVNELEVDDVIKLKPIRCNCGKCLKRQQMQLHSRRQQFDIPDSKLFITEYQQLSCTCPNCGQICLPNGITFTTQGQIDSFSINYPGCSVIGGYVLFYV